MVKKIFPSVTDKEIIDSSLLVFHNMANKTNDEDFEYFLRKAIVYLNALSKKMECEKVFSVRF